MWRKVKKKGGEAGESPLLSLFKVPCIPLNIPVVNLKMNRCLITQDKLKSTIMMVLIALVLLSSAAAESKYAEGLNRWSFLSNPEDILSDQLCPNPMIGGSDPFLIVTSASSRIPVPNDIWAFKTSNPITFLPCDLKPGTHLHLVHHTHFSTAKNTTNSIEHKILFMNISLVPFNFEAAGAKICTKFVKFQFDEVEGVDLACNETPLDPSSMVNNIYWPRDPKRRRKAFSLLRNLERFLQNEDQPRRKFFFQLYFMSLIGKTRKCIVQQYELNLSQQDGHSSGQKGGCRRAPHISQVCGDFSCESLLFPFYGEGNRPRAIWKSGENSEDGKPYLLLPPDYQAEVGNKGRNANATFLDMLGLTFGGGRADIRLVLFLVLLPLVIFGMLIFSLELIVYITCLRRSRTSPASVRDSARSQQILQNSLNLWESIPNRENRTVSFSPVTTSIIHPHGSESPLPESGGTPKVLKSALKKSTEHLPPPPASFFDMPREYPPTYVEAMKH